MKKDNVRDRLFASSVLAGLAITGFAHAQAPVQTNTQTPPAATAEEEEDAIVVTGSRIKQRDFETASPIATVGAEEISLTGTLNVEELLNSLPQVVPGVTVTSNNPSLNGFATAELRNLGEGRTLILVNGRRANPSSSSGLVDLNTIPAALIERIELVTGGASAVYGADAVAGAINFILRDDFEGLDASISYGSSFDGLAPETAFSVAMGTPFADGKGNVSIFAGYQARPSVSASERPWSKNARSVWSDPLGNLISVGPDFVPSAGFFQVFGGGSITPPWGLVTAIGGAFTPANVAAVTGLTLDNDCNPFTGTGGINSTGGNIRFNLAGGIEPFQNCGITMSGNQQSTPSGRSDRYDFSADNFLILENERLNVAAFGEYEISNAATAFMELTYTNSRSQQQLAATPVNPGITVNVDLDRTAGTTVINPYVTANAQLLQLLNLTFGGNLDNRQISFITRPNQGGFRVGTNETNAFGATGGLRGTIESVGYDWEVFASFSRNATRVLSENNVGATALRQVLNACNVTTLAPQTQPLSALPNCPFPGNTALGTFTPTGNSNNPLGFNSMNANMLRFIGVDTTDTITYERTMVGGFLSGEVGDFWGAGPISFAVGTEYRQESLDTKVDAFKEAGDIFGFNAQRSINGRFDLYEFYGEVAVPLLSNLPFVESLEFEGGYRYSNYSTGAGRTDSYKAGLTYSPNDWLTLRTIYNRAVRAPTAFELFRAGDQNFPTVVDPCNAVALNSLTGAALTTRDAACTAWFASAGAVFPNSGGAPGGYTYAQANTQIQSFAFGNQNLTPEIADSYTAGIVFNPEWWPVGRLGVSVDWFNLDVQNQIGDGLTAGQTLTACINAGGLSGAGSPCLLAPRRADGNVDAINLSLTNVPGHIEVRGIDTNVRWSYELEGIGEIGVATLITWYDDDKTTGFTVGADFGGIGSGVPEWRSATSFTFNREDLAVLLRWSWTGAMDQAAIYGNFISPKVKAYNLWTLGASYDLNDNLSLSGSIDNLFDVEPQVTVNSTGNGQFNVDGSSQDQLGRSFRVGLRMRY